MFEIGFSELILVLIVGLVVLGPERLPVAVRTVTGWLKTMRSLASSVQNELTQELKLQELQDSLKKVEEKINFHDIAPELKASIDELRSATNDMQHSAQSLLSDEQSESIQPSTEQPQYEPGDSDNMSLLQEELDDLQMSEDAKDESSLLNKSDTGR